MFVCVCMYWLEFDLVEFCFCFLLLKHGGDVKATDGRLQTALHWAAVQGAVAVADVLLQNGAWVEAADANGYRVLFHFFIFSNYYCFFNVELGNESMTSL